MNIQTNIPISKLTTMRLGGNARTLIDVESKSDLIDAINYARQNNKPLFVIGGGSNLIVHDEGFAGILIRMKIPGFEILDSNDSSTTIKVGAGENWDSIVEKCTNMNLSGIETMSGIPGTAGAAPVQNVGAYGQEIADTLISVEAYDTKNNDFVILKNTDCDFSYRNSIFRSSMYGRYIITAITLRLSKKHMQPPFYESLQKFFNENNITDYSPLNIRNAVLTIRSEKLPNPKYIASAGSFFKNALVDAIVANNITSQYPNLTIHKTDDNKFKIPTGWLIEQADLKGTTINGMLVYDKNALVLVNESAKSYADLSAARQEIIDAVYKKFNIKIEQEPIEL